MVIQLSVKNFRSIRDEIRFTMVPASFKEHQNNVAEVSGGNKLLKTAMLYGPNASGKSNVLRAFKAMEYLVLNSSRYKLGDDIEPYEPFRLDKEFQDAPVEISLDFLIERIRYSYTIVFNISQFILEELAFYPRKQRSMLFSRNAEGHVKYGDQYKGGKKSLEKEMLPNQLFLSRAGANVVESLNQVYLFFRNGIQIVPFLYHYHEGGLSRLFARKLALNRESTFAKKFNKLICALDTGILRVETKEVDWSKYRFPENIPDKIRNELMEEYQFEIKSLHKIFHRDKEVGTVAFDIDEESTGTQSLFSLAGIILDSLEKGKTLVVDEFEKNLHPHITRYLIGLFNSPMTNPRQAQLIFATHDITQLDNDVFRRDQIWFTEKNKFGVTELFSLADVKGVRNVAPYDKWYGSGRFGATPVIDELQLMLIDEEI